MTTRHTADEHPVLEDAPNPPVDEVQQRVYPGPALKVCPDGPWPSIELPARHGAAGTETLTTTLAKILGGPDDKRKRVVIDASAAFFLSFTPTGQGMAVHAANGVARIEVQCIGPIYLKAATGTVEAGWLAEYWAD